MPPDPVPVSTSLLEARQAMLERQEQGDADKLETLRAAIAVGLDDLAAGRFTTLRGDALEEHIRALTTASE